MRGVRSAVLLSLLALAAGTPAYADVTAFVGSTTTPANRPTSGFAVGAGILIVGFEFEYSATPERPANGAPALRTGMGNVLLQTPLPIARMQPYLTTGAGAYREQLGTARATNVGLNSGGGVKVSIAGPLRVRVDYRVFNLRGAPRERTVHRFYVGGNLSF